MLWDDLARIWQHWNEINQFLTRYLIRPFDVHTLCPSAEALQIKKLYMPGSDCCAISRYVGEISVRTQLPFIICMIVNHGQQLCSLFPIMACHYLNQCCLVVGRTKWTNFNEILIEIQIFSFKKIIVCRKIIAILSRPQCAKLYANYIDKNKFYNCLSSAIKLKHQTFYYIKRSLSLTHSWQFFQKSGVYRKFHCNISRVVVAQKFSSRICGRTYPVRRLESNPVAIYRHNKYLGNKSPCAISDYFHHSDRKWARRRF